MGNERYLNKHLICVLGTVVKLIEGAGGFINKGALFIFLSLLKEGDEFCMWGGLVTAIKSF